MKMKGILVEKRSATRKHFEASVEKREPRGTFLSLSLQPRLQKPSPRFFYLGFKNCLLTALFSTGSLFNLDNVGKNQITLEIFFLRVARTIISTKYY